ncbi:hypothetical protein QDY72_04250 [Kingella negevensis]|uniref:hypothetical protein n=1 Tax=Kingella negevensis TaxID=1522312 RepID=UPI00254C5319|nr:hypothetical protein [Kingella negevensis]MDK4684396.1 hypothetical protein [Kingella negevensis]MDK4707578.1 hypothetical protein [Kingella negevensis]MDK4709947.1 hypothetical protein [Kingella negevensis]
MIPQEFGVTIMEKDNPHAFIELTHLIYHALTDNGFDAKVSYENLFFFNKTNIVLSSHSIGKPDLPYFSKENTIIVNTEPMRLFKSIDNPWCQRVHDQLLEMCSHIPFLELQP